MKNICDERKNKGITVIALVITIVVMLILTTVTINVSTDSIEYSKMVKFVSYMQAIQKKVDLISEYENYTEYGNTLTDTQKSQLEEIVGTTIESSQLEQYRAFSKNEISEDFELDDIDDEIVVNFKTREVISLIGVKYEGKMYYTQYELPGGQKIEEYKETNRKVTIDEATIETAVNGLNGIITIPNISISNGTLYYGIKKDNNEEIKWKIITSKTKKGENITTPKISQSGLYIFKLKDNITGESYTTTNGIQLRLTNEPEIVTGIKKDTLSKTYNYSDLDSSKWAYITGDDGSTIYVWIPRFAYKTENEVTTIEFLRKTTDVTTSGGYIDSNWTLPNVFTKNDTELTGVWVEVPSYPQTDLDIIDVLNGTIL